MMTSHSKGYRAQDKLIFDNLIKAEDALGFYCFTYMIADKYMQSLFSSFNPGEISANKEKCRHLSEKGFVLYSELCRQIKQLCHNQDPAVYEYTSELEWYEKQAVAHRLDLEEVEFISKTTKDIEDANTP